MANNLSSEKYLRLTTYTKDKRPKSTPVWFAFSDNDKLCIVTDDDSWKAKRIRRDPMVLVCACDSRGNVESDPESFPGHASIHCSDAVEFEASNTNIAEKYGGYYWAFRIISKLRRKKQCAIMIKLTVDGGA
jgi:PPOX class probable F420-dependent enzyme